MSEEEIIRRRLLFDGDGTGEDRRLNNFVRMATKYIMDGQANASEKGLLYDRMMAELALIKLSRKRSILVHERNQKELKNYQSMRTEYEKKIDDLHQEINTKRKELDIAKVTKENRIEYDRLAKAIVMEPPCKETTARIEVLQKELAELALKKEELDKQLEDKKKQFYVLSTSANALRISLDRDANEGKSDGINNAAGGTPGNDVGSFDPMETGNNREPSVEPMSE